MVKSRSVPPEEILGVRPGASAEEIKAAYLTLARKFHPDRNHEPDAEEKFKELESAMTELSRRKELESLGSFNINDYDLTPLIEGEEVIAKYGRAVLTEVHFSLKKKKPMLGSGRLDIG